MTDSAISDCHGFGNPIGNTVVEAQAEGNSAGKCERYVVSGQLDFLEAVVSFEVSQTVGLLFPVRKFRIPEV